mgnify:CR=1 FL=1
MLTSPQPLILVIVGLLLVMGFALTGNFFHDTQGARISLGAPPVYLTAKAIGSQNINLECNGPSVLSNLPTNITISAVQNQEVRCAGTNLSSVVWALSPIPVWVEDPKKIKRHALQVGNQNNPIFSTELGMNLISIHLGFESTNDDLDDIGKYEDIFVVSTQFTAGIPENTTFIVFQPTTTWTRTPGVMTQSAVATVGVSLTVLILGSLVLIFAIVLLFRKETTPTEYNSL